MCRKSVVLIVAVSFAAMAAHSMLVTTSYNNNTSDNDDHALEDASSSQVAIGSSSATVTTVGNSSGNMGTRFTGQAAGNDGGDITQNINVSVTWTVTAEDWEEYSLYITPQFSTWLNIKDGGLFQENGDGIWFSAMQATLKVNGSDVTDYLDLAGMTREDRGSGSLDRSNAQTLSGYTGNNTFQLIYSGTVTATSKSGFGGDDTSVAGLWGMDGTLDSRYDNDFDSYNSADAISDGAVASDDGLFVDATVTLDAIPEPATLAMLGLFGVGVFGVRRIFMI